MPYGSVQEALRGLQGTVGGMFADAASRRVADTERTVALEKLSQEGAAQTRQSGLRMKAVEQEAYMTKPRPIREIMDILKMPTAGVPEDFLKIPSTFKDFSKTIAESQQFATKEKAEESRFVRTETSEENRAIRSLRQSRQQHRETLSFASQRAEADRASAADHWAQLFTQKKEELATDLAKTLAVINKDDKEPYAYRVLSEQDFEGNKTQYVLAIDKKDPKNVSVVGQASGAAVGSSSAPIAPPSSWKRWAPGT